MEMTTLSLPRSRSLTRTHSRSLSLFLSHSLSLCGRRNRMKITNAPDLSDLKELTWRKLRAITEENIIMLQASKHIMGPWVSQVD